MQIVPAAPSYVASREKKTPRRGAGAPKKKLPEKKIQKLAEVGQEN